jgi:hypothetical protein
VSVLSPSAAIEVIGSSNGQSTWKLVLRLHRSKLISRFLLLVPSSFSASQLNMPYSYGR